MKQPLLLLERGTG